jgi:GAF domain-containing protein
MSKNKDNIHTLCQITIQKLVEYVDAQQGGLFLVNEDDPDHHYLELIAHYAFSEEKINKRFEIGEGYVGTCFRENQFTEVDNLSDHYAELHSGLGKEYLKYLVLAPMKVNEVCIGVLEIGSFRKIKGYRISFIEKLLESFSSIINTERANIQLKKLIEHSRVQAEELHEREEQLRMNIEEITATQEESARREDELIKLAEESATREEILNQEIETLKKTIAEITGKPYDG